MSDFRLAVSLETSPLDRKRLALIGHAYSALEKYFLFRCMDSLPLNRASKDRLHEDFAAVKLGTPWEVRKERVVLGINKVLDGLNAEPISGRLFQGIPSYLDRYIQSGLDLNGEKSPVWESQLRFFSHNTRLQSSVSSNLDPLDPALSISFTTPDLGSWNTEVKSAEVGSLEDAIFNNLSDNLRNVKFMRDPNRSWKALLTFRYVGTVKS